ncbi:LysR family transcriptional regulator [Microbacterium sp. PMB16]|uniref:LysR family transcriptional regulator n=1 Tax=Microbacterium sp. PMB16 TaxID=3120157 RepID=UPI003F4C771E
MESRLLRAFVHTARSSSFSEAAAMLNVTQPALTKQIQQLETLVGSPLFRRGRHGSELTAVGMTLLADAQEIVDLTARFRQRASRIAAGEEGYLSVGFGLSSISVAPRAVARFRAKSPAVSVRLEDMSSLVQLERVGSGHLDVGFTRLPVPGGLRSMTVLSDRLAVATPREWEAPRDGSAIGAWWAQHPLVRLSTARGPGLSAQISQYLSGIDAQPVVTQEADDLQTVLALVSAGIGIAIVPLSATNIAPPRVDMTPLSGRDASWEVGAVWLPGNETPVVRSFLAELAEPGAARKDTGQA